MSSPFTQILQLLLQLHFNLTKTTSFDAMMMPQMISYITLATVTKIPLRRFESREQVKKHCFCIIFCILDMEKDIEYQNCE